VVRRVTAVVLLAALAATASGLLRYLHLQEHLAEARQDAPSLNQSAVSAHHDHDEHDENNCSVCMTLNMPVMATGWAPLLICLGLIAAFLSLLSTPLLQQSIPLRIDCRGPPVA
jgi:hypothetical protein